MTSYMIDSQSVSTSVIQRVMHQVLLEDYGSRPWTYEMLPTVVKDWLLEEGFTKDRVLNTAEEQASSIANVIKSEMAQCL